MGFNARSRNQGPRLPSTFLDGLSPGSNSSGQISGKRGALRHRKEQRKQARQQKKSGPQHVNAQEGRFAGRKRHSSANNDYINAKRQRTGPGSGAGQRMQASPGGRDRRDDRQQNNRDRHDDRQHNNRDRRDDRPRSNRDRRDDRQHNTRDRRDGREHNRPGRDVGTSGPGSSRSGRDVGGFRPPSSGNKFHELLEGGTTLAAGGKGVNSAAAYLADLRAAREAEKKLGIKKGGNLKGPSDGLDLLLSGLGSAAGSLLPGYLSKGAAEQARNLLAGQGGKKGSKNKTSAQDDTQHDMGGGGVGLLDDESDPHGLGVLGQQREGDESDTDDDMAMALAGSDDDGSDSEGEGDEDEDDDMQGEEEYDDDVDDDNDDEVAMAGGSGPDQDQDQDQDDDSDDDDGGLSSDDDGDMPGSEDGDVRSGSDEDEDADDSEGDGEDESDDMYNDEVLDFDDVDGLSGSDDDDKNQSDASASDDDGDAEGDDGHGKQLAGSGRPSMKSDKEVAGGIGQAPSPASATGKYVPPALRRAAAAGGVGGVDTAMERRITGLLNRLADANLAAIAKDLADLYENHSRRSVTTTVIQQLLQAAVRGPRATQAFAATAASLVAGLSGSCRAAELAAGFLEAAAQQLEECLTTANKDTLAAHNLTQLLASCHAAGLVSTDLMFGLLTRLASRFTEDDVQIIVSLLNGRGLALRSAEPAAMKDFVLQVGAKVAELSKQGTADGGAVGVSGLSTRARLMLELVIDIKNNRPTKAAGGGKGSRADGRAGGAGVALSPTATAWLKGCSVESVAVRGITWDKLLAPNKKGMWWMPEAGEALGRASGSGPGTGASLLAAVSAAAGAGVGDDGGAAEAARLLSLAAAQRMNTDSRRAVFVAVMGAADVVDAHERLLRLPLKGEQQREVVRVVVDCCLHETTYNPFYGLLIARLSGHSKAHRLTAQFCMWDQYKAMDGHTPSGLAHLARLNAALVAKDVLSITSLKVVDWSGMTEPKSIFFWRLFFQHLLAACNATTKVMTVFGKAAGASSSSGSGSGGASLKSGLLLFLRTRMGPWLAEQEGSAVVAGKATVDDLLVRLRLAEAAVKGEQVDLLM